MARSRRALHEPALAAAERAFAVLAERVGGGERLERMEPSELKARRPDADHSDAAHLYFASPTELTVEGPA